MTLNSYQVGPFNIFMQEDLIQDSLKDATILDIGGGGEGIIAQYAGQISKVISIDPRTDELAEARGNALKIQMDASDLKFIDEQFDIATSFFTLMYIPYEKKIQVFKEVFRVLKQGGHFVIWDKGIDDKNLSSTYDAFIIHLNIHLSSDLNLETGYGVSMVTMHGHDFASIKNIATSSGFFIENEVQSDFGFFIKLTKGKGNI